MKRSAISVVAVVSLAMSACADEELGTPAPSPALSEPEIVHRPGAGIVALAREGSTVVVVHDQGIDRFDTNDGSVSRVVGGEYRVCPDPLKGELAPVFLASDVAVSGDTLVISLTACRWALWTLDLVSGQRRELAPLEPDGDWPGIDEFAIPVTIHEGRVFTSVGRHRIPEFWAFDLRDGRREKIASLDHLVRTCAAPLVDDTAVYVACTEDSFEDVLWRIDLATREITAMARLGFPIDFAQDKDALYLANMFGPVVRVEKSARWSGGATTWTNIDWPAGRVGAIAVENGIVFGAGVFSDNLDDVDRVWSALPSAHGRELATLRVRDTRFRSISMRGLVATERALFAAAFSEETFESVLIRIPR
jgi:hypothetical protein